MFFLCAMSICNRPPQYPFVCLGGWSGHEITIQLDTLYPAQNSVLYGNRQAHLIRGVDMGRPGHVCHVGLDRPDTSQIIPKLARSAFILSSLLPRALCPFPSSATTLAPPSSPTHGVATTTPTHSIIIRATPGHCHRHRTSPRYVLLLRT